MAYNSERTNNCMRLLLDTGADPTIPPRTNDTISDMSPLQRVLLRGQEDYDLLEHFNISAVHLGTPTWENLSTWLYTFYRQANDHIFPDMVESLLKACCNINETTKNCPGFPDGWNCVFFLVLYADDKEGYWEFESLRLLLGHSVNISYTRKMRLV